MKVRREIATQAGCRASDIPRLPDFDSNVITPGTAFMWKLAAAVRAYVQHRLLCDPLWQHLQVRPLW